MSKVTQKEKLEQELRIGCTGSLRRGKDVVQCDGERRGFGAGAVFIVFERFKGEFVLALISGTQYMTAGTVRLGLGLQQLIISHPP